MYNETYDNYIRSILGYSPMNQFEQYEQGQREYQNYEEYRNPTFNTNINISGNNIELENSYPEIYKIVYPMVAKKCENIAGRTFTKDDIENMTDEVYYALESKNETNVNIANNMSGVKKVSNTNVAKIDNRKFDTKIGVEDEKRQFNPGLRDLIKILLIRELLNKSRPPFRPPMQNPPRPRPPMRPLF